MSKHANSFKMKQQKLMHLQKMRNFVLEYLHECRDKKRILKLNVVSPNTFGSHIVIEVANGSVTMIYIDDKRKMYIRTTPVDVNVEKMEDIDFESGFKKTIHAKVFDNVLIQVTSVIDESLVDGLMFIDHDREKLRPLVDRWMDYIATRSILLKTF